MRVFVYNMRDYDERPFFDDICLKEGVEYGYSYEAPTVENAVLARGYDAIDIITCPVDRPRLEALKKAGIRLIISRTVGTDHIDREAAKQLGIDVIGITYTPGAVADYTVMLILMGCRRFKYLTMRTVAQDYGLEGRIGKDLSDSTVGIIGGGPIGKAVARRLSGFDCRILMFDRHTDEEIAGIAEYADFDRVIKESDILSLHLAGRPENRHIIKRDTFAMMKDGVHIINTARGLLMDTEALIDNIESGKVGFAGLDVIENEIGRYYYDHGDEVLTNRQISIINGFPNAFVLPHMAFYTEAAVRDMVVNSIIKGKEYFNGEISRRTGSGTDGTDKERI